MNARYPIVLKLAGRDITLWNLVISLQWWIVDKISANISCNVFHGLSDFLDARPFVIRNCHWSVTCPSHFFWKQLVWRTTSTFLMSVCFWLIGQWSLVHDTSFGNCKNEKQSIPSLWLIQVIVFDLGTVFNTQICCTPRCRVFISPRQRLLNRHADFFQDNIWFAGQHLTVCNVQYPGGSAVQVTNKVGRDVSGQSRGQLQANSSNEKQDHRDICGL